MTIGPNFVFVAVPRTGSTWLATKVLPKFSGVMIGDDPHANRVPEKHQNKLIFTVVRNPYDRMLSVWHHLRRHDTSYGIDKMGFHVFISLLRYKRLMNAWGPEGGSQSEFLRLVNPNVILRYERLYEGLQSLPFIVGEITRRRVNASDRPPWQEEIQTPGYIEAVHGHSHEDFEAFGYEQLQEATDVQSTRRGRGSSKDIRQLA